MMSSIHLLYIPLLVFVGLVLGVFLGRRSAMSLREEEELLRRRRLAREDSAVQEDRVAPPMRAGDRWRGAAAAEPAVEPTIEEA